MNEKPAVIVELEEKGLITNVQEIKPAGVVVGYIVDIW
jgi:hypothetical protein